MPSRSNRETSFFLASGALICYEHLMAVYLFIVFILYRIQDKTRYKSLYFCRRGLLL